MSTTTTRSPAKKPSTAQEADQQPNTPPEARIQYGHVSAGIWPSSVTDSNGVERPSWMVMLSRSYKVDGNYRRSKVLFPQDLLAASYALQKAFDYIEEARQIETASED